jgi:hypothetical protein
MKQIWKLTGARQASFGILTDNENWWLTLKESFGEVDLSVEYGVGVEPVGALADSATDEEVWTALADLEKWTSTTYASQEAAREEDRLADA